MGFLAASERLRVTFPSFLIKYHQSLALRVLLSPNNDDDTFSLPPFSR